MEDRASQLAVADLKMISFSRGKKIGKSACVVKTGEPDILCLAIMEASIRTAIASHRALQTTSISMASAAAFSLLLLLSS